MTQSLLYKWNNREYTLKIVVEFEKFKEPAMQFENLCKWLHMTGK